MDFELDMALAHHFVHRGFQPGNHTLVVGNLAADTALGVVDDSLALHLVDTGHTLRQVVMSRKDMVKCTT